MDGEANGGQEAKDAQGAQAQPADPQEAPQEGHAAVTPDYERQIAERDERIAALEAQVADAAKSAETAEELRAQIAELKAQGESDRIDFSLRLAGARNLKAARAVLDDYKGDVGALAEAEPWLFDGGTRQSGATGATGLPNAGAASDPGRTLRRWRRIADLEDTEE